MLGAVVPVRSNESLLYPSSANVSCSGRVALRQDRFAGGLTMDDGIRDSRSIVWVGVHARRALVPSGSMAGNGHEMKLTPKKT